MRKKCEETKMWSANKSFYILLAFLLIKDIDIYSGDTLSDEKPYKTYENILIYDISCKTFMGLILLGVLGSIK